MASLSCVSIIIPCRNERRFIGICLESIISNDYPKQALEVLVVDGMSEDGTPAIVMDYAQKYSFITLLENPQKITPSALNIAIRKAKGEIIMRMDAHASYDRDYISKCVRALCEYSADNVGGVWRIVPRADTLVGRAIARSLSHRFGVGNAHYRLANCRQPKWVDTVPFMCCREEVFQRIGLFNENRRRGQDMEFSLRLRHAGGRTLLVPDIASCYFARSDMKAFWQHNWTNGVWAILPFLYSDIVPVSWRHLVPLAFVVSLLTSAGLAMRSPTGLWILGSLAGVYTGASLAASLQVSWRERDPRYLALMPLVFSSLHIGYGLGSLWGVVRTFAVVLSGLDRRRQKDGGSAEA